MGKRELVLILAFIFAGTLLYHATAPPSPGGGFSLRGMVDNLRRHVGPRHEYLADERTITLPLESGAAEVRISGRMTLQVNGGDFREATAKVQIYSTGVDEQEARALGKRTVLKTAASGDIFSLEFEYPPEERQRAVMTLNLPRRMRVRVRGATSIQAGNLAGLELDDTRGEVTATAMTGPIRGTHTGGELTFDNVTQIDLTARRTDLTIARVSGSTRLDLTGGALQAREVTGAVSLDASRAAIELEQVNGPLTANLTQGSLEMTRVLQQVRVDARSTELRFELDRPAAITAITSDENISVRLPEKIGFTLDATVEDGDIRVPAGAPLPATSNQVSRARGPINGGGPTLALRTSHGDIVIR